MIPNNRTFSNHYLLDFMVQGKITEVDTATVQLGATSSELVSEPPPSSPHFYAGYPSCCNPSNLSRLGTGTGICWIAYLVAGLHTPMAWSISCNSVSYRSVAMHTASLFATFLPSLHSYNLAILSSFPTDCSSAAT